MQAELSFSGVYRISPEGKPTLLVNDFERPNGLAFSPVVKLLLATEGIRP